MNMAVAATKVRRMSSVREQTIIFAPPSPHKNRGDEALLMSLLRGLEARGLSADVYATGKDSLSFLESTSSVQYHRDSHLVFTTLSSKFENINLISRMHRAKEIILVGADVVDEGYGKDRSYATLRFLEKCVQLNIPCRIVSFSMNEVPSPALKGKFQSIVKKGRLFVRDPRSVERLHNAGVANITPAGDLAYLLEPVPMDATPKEVLNFVHSCSGPVVGLNLIRKVLGTGEVFKEKIEIISQACSELARMDNCKFLLIPHDDYEDSTDLAEVSGCMSAKGGKDWCMLVNPVPRAALAKRIVGLCTHVFTCRLHLGIATLGMGRPFTGFPYQGKFEGQFDLFGLSHEGLITADVFPKTYDEMVAMMRQRILQSESLAAQIQSKLPEVHALSRVNFDGLGIVVDKAVV